MINVNILQIKTRDELPLFLNKLSIIGKGVEIGVEKGEYSEVILKHSKLEILYSVDSWKEFPGEEYQDTNNHNQSDHDKNRKDTELKLSKYKKRSQILHMVSSDAAKKFKDNELDFIYIDANHSYEGCKKDIELWYPKMRAGGVFAGHDYLHDGEYNHGTFGVKGAVDEFINKHNFKLYITKDVWPTWYIILPYMGK